MIKTLGFLGFGNMGGAIARGVVAAGIVEAKNIWVFDPGLPDSVINGRGFAVAPRPIDVFENSDVVILAVKPQVAKEKRDEWKALFEALSGTSKVFISIMAGIKASWLREIAPRGAEVVRVMPNLGLSVGAGATAIAADGASERSLEIAETVFDSCGTTVRVEEADMDAVTAVSGSGPMYVFEFIEAMTAAGEKAGLTRETAYSLVRQTVLGSLELLKPVDGAPSASPDEWSARVRSPGGTTAAAQDLLRAEGFRDLLARAVEAARNRSIELS